MDRVKQDINFHRMSSRICLNCDTIPFVDLVLGSLSLPIIVVKSSHDLQLPSGPLWNTLVRSKPGKIEELTKNSEDTGKLINYSRPVDNYAGNSK